MGWFSAKKPPGKPAPSLSREQQGRLEQGRGAVDAATRIASEVLGVDARQKGAGSFDQGKIATALKKAYLVGYARSGGQAAHTSYDEIAAVSAKIMRDVMRLEPGTGKTQVDHEALRRALLAAGEVGATQGKDPKAARLTGPYAKQGGGAQPKAPAGPIQQGPRGGQFRQTTAGGKVYVGGDGKQWRPVKAA